MFKIKKNKNMQYVVFGLGRFGTEIVRNLTNADCEVLAVDIKEDRVNAVINMATHAVVADITDENVLKDLGIESFDVAVIAVGTNVQSSILCAMSCKELGVKKVVAKANSARHAAILEKLGVDKIIIPEADSAQRMVALLLNPELNDITELAGGYSIAELSVPEEWIGKKLVDIDVRKKYNVNVLLILNENATFVPHAETLFAAGDRLIIGAIETELAECLRMLNN